MESWDGHEFYITVLIANECWDARLPKSEYAMQREPEA